MLDIRVIAKVEGDSSRRLAIRVCGLIQITFAIALLYNVPTKHPNCRRGDTLCYDKGITPFSSRMISSISFIYSSLIPDMSYG